MHIQLSDGERMDKIGFNDLRLIQKPEDFCYGVDAVILSHFAATGGEQERQGRVTAKRSMDLGTGTGIIPLILSHKTDIEEIYGMELQPENYERARRNVQLNGLESRIKIVNGDVSQLRCVIPENLLGTFDMVTSNPPYMTGNGALKNKNRSKMLSRHESSGTLDDFIKAAADLLKPKGDFYMVHRPGRLIDISVSCRNNKLEPKGIRFVAPREGEKPNILLIHCVKNGGAELKFMKNLNVYEGKGYSQEINSIYEK